MKKMLSVVLAVAVLTVGAQLAQAKKDDSSGSSTVQIGIVDMNRALNEVNEGKRAKAKLEAEGKKKKQKLEIMQKELEKMRDDLEKQKLILSQDALQKKQQAFQQKFMELQRTSMQYEQEFTQNEAQAIKPIVDKLQRVVQEIGREKNFLMVVPKEVAIYSPAGTDITSEVIATYNKK